MKVFASVYEYSKDKSSTILNKKKPEEVKVEKKVTCWAKSFCTKFEETKNASYSYLEKMHKKIKTKSSSLFANFPFFRFDYNSKYNMYPWYTRLYYIIKDQIKTLIKVKDSEDRIVSTEVAKVEKRKPKKKLSGENLSNNVNIDDTDAQSVLCSKYSNDLTMHRNCKKLKRNNTETISGHESFSRTETETSNMNALLIKRHTSTNNNTLRSVRKNNYKDAEEEQFCDVNEATELTDVTNNKEEVANDTNNEVTNIGEEVVSNENEDTSNKNEKQRVLSPDMVKKFNIKNTWAKLSNIIS